MSYDLFIFTGETSGDVHGATLVRQLQSLYPDIRITGVPGPKMRALGVDCFMPMENFQIMGYSDVFKNIFRLIGYFKEIRTYILKEKPKAVLFVDYPGFNLRMAKSLRKYKFKNKLIHYICPTVWAHGKKRVYTLASTLDLLLSIFPFEEKYFAKTSLKPTYIGHPLIEEARAHKNDGNFREKYNLPKDQKLFGVYPGSRSMEIRQNFPKILESCHLIRQKNPDAIFLISVVNDKLKKLMSEMIDVSQLKLNQDLYFISSKDNFQMMDEIHTAIATSGTITFELGVKKVPTVVVYHLTRMNAWIARYWIRLNLPYYCIVNIITKKHIFPELYHLDFLPQKVANTFISLSEDSYLRRNALEGCEEMLQIMDSKEAPSRLAAKEIGSVLYAR